MLEQNDFSLASQHEKTRSGQENEDSPPDAVPSASVTRSRQKRKLSHDMEGCRAEPRESILRSTKKQKTSQDKEDAATTFVSVELDHHADQCAYGMNNRDASEIQQVLKLFALTLSLNFFQFLSLTF